MSFIPFRRLAVMGAALAVVGIAMPVAQASDIPTYSIQTYDLTAKALTMYRAIAAEGGWPELPADVAALGLNARGPMVVLLKQRLVIEQDLPDVYAGGDVFDQDTEAAL
eukprot:gene27899-30951_t